MDLINWALSAVSSAIDLGFKELDNLRAFPLFYDPDNQRRLVFHGRDIYLRISDLLLDENGRMRDVALLRMPEDAAAIAAIRPESPEPHRLQGLRGPRELQPQVKIDNFLAKLSDSGERSVRIYIEQGLGPQVFKNYFSADVTDATRRTYAHPATRGYNGLSFQWRTPEPNAWFEAPYFILSGQDPPGLVISVKKVSTVEHSGDKLILLISSETWESSGFSGMHPITDNSQQASARVLESLKRFALDFEQLQDNYQPLLRKANTSQRRKQVLLLWFHHVHLSHTTRSFEEVRWMYQEVREWRVDSGKFKLLPHLLDEVITDTNFFKELEAMAEDLASTLEALLGVVGVGFEGHADGAPEFNTVAADLRGLSSDLRRKAGDIPKTLAHHLHFLEMRRSIGESNRLSMLTILASIFLPLSLACGILSMETRLKDLKYILYDFCGVTVLLLTLVALLLLLVKGSMTIMSRISGWDPFGKQLVTIGLAAIVPIIWAVILASFIVGMAVDVRLGGLVLGYGLAGLTGLTVLNGVATLVLACMHLISG
ncbi:hypothetical protein INS49_008882 [Diaporthe citri]|uniref:uncharacterized protein n=1 Tax=Diaporthe citri TaxID=83186 RepID=UPI001C81D686|nr:uncharacterized protein INS49_008882 [Diaporthe citri]KAG6363779.1 hypothetical protein INS49_008882 [Diaporthe citri]